VPSNAASNTAANVADCKENNMPLNRQRHSYTKACMTGSWNVRKQLSLQSLLKLGTLWHILDTSVCSGKPRLPVQAAVHATEFITVGLTFKRVNAVTSRNSFSLNFECNSSKSFCNRTQSELWLLLGQSPKDLLRAQTPVLTFCSGRSFEQRTFEKRYEFN